MVPLSWYLALSAVLFTIGVAGVLIQRNAIVLFMCIELMLNSVNLTLVAFSRFLGDVTGQLFRLHRDGCRRRRSCGWIGHHYCAVQNARNAQRGRSRFTETVMN
jgi:hypothetical protein